MAHADGSSICVELAKTHHDITGLDAELATRKDAGHEDLLSVARISVASAVPAPFRVAAPHLMKMGAYKTGAGNSP